MNRILAVDIGNTHTHIALMEGSHVLHKENLSTGELCINTWPKNLQHQEPYTAIHLCSVVPRLSDALFTLQLPVPIKRLSIKNDPFSKYYKDPSKLGEDRIVAMHYASHLFPESSFAIFDFGSAITLDVVVANIYKGGHILPGRRMQEQALHSQTAQLPQVEYSKLTEIQLGLSTEDCIQAGIAANIAGWLTTLQAWLRAEYGPHLKMIGIGGDPLLQSHKACFDLVDSDFVLKGLATCL